jgi:hypothetical protein
LAELRAVLSNSIVKICGYKEYLLCLKETGFTEIEHAGSHLKYASQRNRLKNAVEEIHTQSMKAYFYTGVFGTKNLHQNKELMPFAQRDKHGNILGYLGKDLKTAMMCPTSDYVDHVIIPKLLDRMHLAQFDGVFFDIPWVMKSGCYCTNCKDLRANGANNAILVRNSLLRIVSVLRTEHPLLSICINASAPTIHDNRYSGGHSDNLKGIFDEYLTEWNPYRWNQDVSVVSRCIDYAAGIVNGRLLHATTATNRLGKMYTIEQYVRLFSAILNGGATPRLGIGFPEKQLRIIGDAWRNAVESENS